MHLKTSSPQLIEIQPLLNIICLTCVVKLLSLKLKQALTKDVLLQNHFIIIQVLFLQLLLWSTGWPDQSLLIRQYRFHLFKCLSVFHSLHRHYVWIAVCQQKCVVCVCVCDRKDTGVVSKLWRWLLVSSIKQAFLRLIPNGSPQSEALTVSRSATKWEIRQLVAQPRLGVI